MARPLTGTKRQIRGRGAGQVWELRAAGKSRRFTGTAEGAGDALATFLDEIRLERAPVVEQAEAPAGQTFGQYLDEWLPRATIDGGLAPTTIRENKRTIEKVVKPALGDVPLVDLSKRQLEEFYRALVTRKERPLSPSTVRRIHAVISSALADAVADDALTVNPAAYAKRPKVTARQIEAPTPEQVRAMLAAAEADDTDMATLIALAALTGARRGEICGLRLGDVDWQANTITIRRSVGVVDGIPFAKGTKSGALRQPIPMVPALVEYVSRQRANLEERADDLGVELTDDTPLLTYDLVHPIHPDTATQYVRSIAKSVGVTTHLHALRHYAGTRLIGAGVDLRTVSDFLGHSNPTTTLRFYSHAIPGSGDKAAAVLGELLVVPVAELPA